MRIMGFKIYSRDVLQVAWLLMVVAAGIGLIIIFVKITLHLLGIGK